MPFIAARGIVAVPRPTQDPNRDEAFIRAVRGEFPTLVTRQVLPAGVPPNVARVHLASTSSQLTVSAMQAEFAVQFYGTLLDDTDGALAYIERKMRAVLEGMVEAAGADDLQPTTIGLIANVHLSRNDEAIGSETAELVGRLLAVDAAGEIEDAFVRVGLRVGGTHFVSLVASNYQQRGIQRMILPGLPVTLDPWDGEVTDHGIELVVDVNNRLGAITAGAWAPVGQADLDEAIRLLRVGVLTVGQRFALEGVLDTAPFAEA